jgi:uncharacterized RDD family membrane protein YckC
MTSSQPRYEDPLAQVDSPSVDQPPAAPSSAKPPTRLPAPVPPPPVPPPPGWPAPCVQSPQVVRAPHFGQPPQPVPPPRFGRLPHGTRSPEIAGAGVLDPDPGLHLQALGHQARLATPVTPENDTGARSAPPSVSLANAVPVPGPPLADFGARVVSFSIDFVIPAIVLNLLLAIGSMTVTPEWSQILAVVGYLGLLGFGLWNSGYLQGTTGRSLGRRVANSRLVMMQTGQPVGFGRAVVRQICHLLEFGIGYLWPLWDVKHQTFADKIVGTVVVRAGASAGSPVDRRRVGE